MTYEKLQELISALTPEQRKRPAVIAMRQTGEVAEIEDLIPINDFNGTELPDQFTLWYDARKDPEIY